MTDTATMTMPGVAPVAGAACAAGERAAHDTATGGAWPRLLPRRGAGPAAAGGAAAGRAAAGGAAAGPAPQDLASHLRSPRPRCPTAAAAGVSGRAAASSPR